MGCDNIFYIKVKRDNKWEFLPLISENIFGDRELAHFCFRGWEKFDIIKDCALPAFLTDEEYKATGYEKEDEDKPDFYEISYALIKYLAAKEYTVDEDPDNEVKQFWAKVDTMIGAGLDFAGLGWKHIDYVKVLIEASY